MDERLTVNLGELGEFRNGANFSQNDYGPGFPIVNVKQLYQGRYASTQELLELSASAISNPEAVFLRRGDILFARSSVKASGAGQVAMVGPCLANMVFSGFIIRLRVTATDRVLPDYLNYLLRSPDYREVLTRIGTGTSITNLSQGTLGALKVTLPRICAQQQVVGVLGALDDKIELNERMNRTLEALIQTLFKDWFIAFGPTYAKMEGRSPYLVPALWKLFPDTVNDEGIPTEWRRGSLGVLAEPRGVVVDPSEVEPDIPYIGLEHMPRRCVALGDWGTADNVTSGKAAFRRGDVLFGKLRPYFHKVGIAAVDGICSTDIVVVRPKEEMWRSFVLACISSKAFVDFTDRSSTGTKMPRTSWKAMARYELAVPDSRAASAFNDICRPMIERVIANIHESHTLAKTRDLLLPKLMSGEIRLRDAEKVVESVA